MSHGPTRIGAPGRGVDALSDAFYPLYRRLLAERRDFVDDVERKLAQARMPNNVEMYLSTSLALGTVTGLVFSVAGLLLGYVLFVARGLVTGPLVGLPTSNETVIQVFAAARLPFLVALTTVAVGAVGFVAAFGGTVLLPYLRAGRRRREINMLLPDAVSFMYALSVGGMNQLEIFEAIAAAEDTYGEVSREFRTILQETEYFDTDYRSSIRRRAFETPSDELNQFLTDMLSVIDSGGDMTRFLEDKKMLHFRTAKQEQERTIETLELFAEVFVTISLFPLLLIIVLIILSILGQGQPLVLYATVYVLVPVLGAIFIVLISTVIHDDPGDGVLESEERTELFESETDRGPFHHGFVERFVGRHDVFDRIKRREGTFETLSLLRRPDLFFRDHPTYTLALTVPAALMFVGTAIVTDAVPTTWAGLVDAPVRGTFVYMYLPLFVVGVPVGVFYEWNVRARQGILKTLPEDLRKLSSANDTGLTLLESIRTVAETSSGRLADELSVVYAKSRYGMSLTESLVVLNNRYRLPQLARTTKLITKAQEASSQISSVLTTAAQAAENREDIERERRSRTRMQVVIVLMTYLTLLGVMAVLKVRFIDVFARLAAEGATGARGSFTATVDADLLSVLFFHAVTLQAVVAGLVSGYLRDARLLSGVKYVVGLLAIALTVWAVIG